MTWRGTTTTRDRIFACLPYLLPLVEGLVYGSYLFREFPPLSLILLPLSPVIQLFQAIPFAELIVFFGLYFLVIRNENISHFIRFNAMQAILLDIILILCGLILGIVSGGMSAFIVETISNTIFLGLLATFVYAVVQSIRGQYAEIPGISDAVYMQVR
ncbi:MAG: Tic20 family protein [Cyanobacteriota bacterium]|nr:Tic20 family protein [Cyanobacteriota bacterium]